MRRQFAGLLLLCGLVTCPVMARLPFDQPIFEFDIAGGYRQDSLKWSVKGPRENPTVASDLKWRHLQMTQVAGSASFINCDNYYFRLNADYGWIYSGRSSDSDFAIVNGHKQKFLKSTSKADRGYVFDLSAGLGYFFPFLTNRAALLPIIGYSHHEQHLTQRDVFVEFDSITHFTGPEAGVKNRYNTRWYGPWVGMDFVLQMTCNLGVFGGGEFHWARFHARGHWNQRTDFVRDFRQTSRGWGQIYTLGFNYDLGCNWSICLVGNYIYFKTKAHGKDETFFSHGSVDNRLNRVRWHSYCVMGALAYIY